ncbi:MAG: septum formation protein Maf [Mailhella sp.]|nr:septum formation protein Maf [Mailhella sp.]
MTNAFTILRPLVLASGSPRRRAFLEGMGIPFEVLPADCPEPRPLPGEDPREYTNRCAEAKARHVLASLAHRGDSPAVLSADTTVIIRDEHGSDILGKPRDKAEAVAMLSRLSGRTHQVVTACCLAMDGHVERFDDVTDVTFAAWPLPLIEAYADSGDPLDKAGAYGIQEGGAFMVQSIRGSWSTVVGLPLDIVLERLLAANVLKLNEKR